MGTVYEQQIPRLAEEVLQVYIGIFNHFPLKFPRATSRHLRHLGTAVEGFWCQERVYGIHHTGGFSNSP